jgi:hypothetical protein
LIIVGVTVAHFMVVACAEGTATITAAAIATVTIARLAAVECRRYARHVLEPRWQFIHRSHFVIDPSGDRDLRTACSA